MAISPVRPAGRATSTRALIVDVASEGIRLPVSHERVRAAVHRTLRAEKVQDAMISIAFVTNRRIAALNWTHLRHRGPTDVISFAFAPLGRGGALVGDVYIASAVARRNAVAHGQRIRDELLRLVVHGTLHVIGRTHPEDESRYVSPMWRRQERVLRELGVGA